jgi:signal transduction histidine kinase
MKAPVYRAVIILMGISAVGMIGLQGGFLYRQYRQQQLNFDFNVQRAIGAMGQVYARWTSHTSAPSDTKSFNALYTNSDSTFTVMIAQSAQQYPLLDFEADTLLPKIRWEQFLRFKDELEATRRADNKGLHEFYLFRTIQYCADCKEDSLSVAQVFPLDSVLRAQLAAHQIRTPTIAGFYHKTAQRYMYVSPPAADTSGLALTAYTYDFPNGEQLRLFFPEKDRIIAASLLWPSLASLVLVLVSLSGFWLALRVIFRQKELSELKSDFINNVTHEFKTPISTIAFAVANIENEQIIQEPSHIRQFTKVIREENKRLNLQVERVLQAALSEGKALQLKKEPLDVHELIIELADATEMKIGPGGALHRELKAARTMISGDAFHLRNAVSNLLDNAVKYSGHHPDITVSTESNAMGLFIRVADKGIGIDKAHQELIFDKFFRVPHGNVHNVKGFGLGLSYVKEIVEKHRGSIKVSSKPGEGSVFSVYLPFEGE